MNNTREQDFRIGCSGYYYASWRNKFYPQGLKPAHWLTHYSTIFNTVELNGTFYRVPKLKDLERYYENTPKDFAFSVKMNRYVTHILKLKGAGDSIMEFETLMYEGLKNKLHTILYQLPPSFVYTPENADALFENVNPGFVNVIEFRHPSWWDSDIAAQMEKAGLTFCNTDYPGLHHTFTQTSPVFYARMHGVPELFKSTYSKTYLDAFAQHIPKEAGTAYIYFNNTWFDGAYTNAIDLIQKVK